MALARRPILLLLNGDIHTMDAATPHVTALAIDRSSGRILAAGDDAEIRALAGPLTETLNLGGRTALPGFIDAHTHLAGYAQSRLNVDLRHISSEDAAVAKVRERVATLPAGAWVYGQSWDVNEWPGQHFPTKASLDAVAPGHPVMLESHDFHSAWVNTLALRLAGITAATPDPDGGRIERDGAGEPTGMLFEGPAMDTAKTTGGGTTTTLAYDQESNVTSFTDPTGTVNYRYDNANRLTALAEPGGSCPGTLVFPNSTKCTGFSYDGNNRRTVTSYPNGVKNTTVYDNAVKTLSSASCAAK